MYWRFFPVRLSISFSVFWDEIETKFTHRALVHFILLKCWNLPLSLRKQQQKRNVFSNTKELSLTSDLNFWGLPTLCGPQRRSCLSLAYGAQRSKLLPYVHSAYFYWESKVWVQFWESQESQSRDFFILMVFRVESTSIKTLTHCIVI